MVKLMHLILLLFLSIFLYIMVSISSYHFLHFLMMFISRKCSSIKQ